MVKSIFELHGQEEGGYPMHKTGGGGRPEEIMRYHIEGSREAIPDLGEPFNTAGKSAEHIM